MGANSGLPLSVVVHLQNAVVSAIAFRIAIATADLIGKILQAINLR